MKIPIKYGLLITLFVMAWVIASHAIVTNPQSAVHTLGPLIVFNVVQFVMIYLGLRALQHAKGDRPTFKEGLKTGVLISLVYAITASLFFACALALMGPKFMAGEPSSANDSPSLVATRAFVGLFLTAMVTGLIYSTLIAFFLAKRQSESVQ